MAGDGLLSLRWNNHRTSFLQVLSSLRDKKTYSDVTIACAGKFYSVHKFVLSTCSDYFVDIMEKTPCKHPIIVLKDIRHQDLEALLNYMYLGEVNVLQNELAGLIKAAECLRIKGLAVPDESPPLHPGETIHSPVKNCEEGSPQTKRRHEDESTNSNSSPPRKRSNSRLHAEGIVESTLTEDHSEASENKMRENILPSVQQAQEQQSNNASEHPAESSLPIPSDERQNKHAEVENPVIKVEEEDVKYEDEDGMQLPDTCNALEVQMTESDGSSQGTARNSETVLKYEASLSGSAGGAPLLSPVTQYSTHPQSFEEIVSQALPGPSGIQGDGQSWDSSRREGDMTSFHLQGFSQQDRLNPHHHSLQQVDLIEDTVHRVRGSVCSEGGVPRGSCTLGQYGMEIPQLADSRMDLEIRQAKEWRCLFPKCGYVTDRESWLRQHFRKHTGEKPFPCPYCSFRSAQKGNLNVHVKRVHCELPGNECVVIKPDYLNIS